MTHNPWAWWQAALAGDFGPIHESDPQAGYFRRKLRDGGWSPVAIWREGDALICLDGGQPKEATEVWTWCCRTPITYELYEAVTDRGEGWPDLPPAAGHNLGLTPFETLANELAGEKAEIDRLLTAGPIKDKATADRLSNWTARISDIKTRADAERVAEKRPHDDAASAVQAKWKPLVDDAAALARRMKDAIGAYLTEQAKAAAAERARAAAEGAPIKAVENARAGSIGRKVALRTVKSADITDLAKAAAFIAAMSNPPVEFVEVVRKLADKMLKAGVDVPGAILTEKQIAA